MSSTLGALQIADWRRRVFGLYAGVRQLSASRPEAGHELWRSGRDELFAGHPSSPLLPDDRAAFTGLPVVTYDPDWRFEVEVHRAAEPHRIEVETCPFKSSSLKLLYLMLLTISMPAAATSKATRNEDRKSTRLNSSHVF